MRNKLVLTLAAVALVSALAGCNTRTDKTDTGGIILTVTDFDGVPTGASVNCLLGEVAVALCNPETFGFPRITIESLTISNIVADPSGTSSRLMDVELERIQVGFHRADNGTRVPPTQVRGFTGFVPVNGTETVNNLPVLTSEGFVNPPLSDLRLLNGGVDSETGSETILIEFELIFFGRTLSGDPVETAPFRFTVEFFA